MQFITSFVGALLLLMTFVASGQSPATPSPTGPGSLLWSFPTQMTPGGGPIVAGNTIYFNVNTTVFALDAETGAMRWNWITQCCAATASPAYSQGSLFLNMNFLFRLDAKTGRQLRNSTNYNGYIGTPIIQENAVFWGSSYQNVYSMTTNFTSAVPFSGGSTHGASSPIAMIDPNTIAYCGSRSLQVFDVITHSFSWSYPLSQSDNVAKGTARLGDLLFVPNNQEFLALNVTVPGGPTGFTWWFLTKTPVVAAPEVSPHDGLVYVAETGVFAPTLWALNAATGAVAWSFTNNGMLGSLYCTPVYHNGRVYLGTDYYNYDTPNFFALDAKTGSVVWSFTANGDITNKPVVSGNSIVFITSRGTVHALRI